MKPVLMSAIMIMISAAFFAGIANQTTGQTSPPKTIGFVNSCTAENHSGTTNINCVISTTAGNWIVATATGAGTNANCAGNPNLGVNSFSFDAGALYTNWHGANKLSVEVYDSGLLITGGSLTVVFSGQCFLNFASLIVYQFSGVTAASVSASINTCSNQSTGVTTLSCSLTSLPGYGWIVGHAAADCTACSFKNQVNTIIQPSGSNFTDYAGVITSATPNAANSFTVTNGASFNGGVSAIEITGPNVQSNETATPGLTPIVRLLPLFAPIAAIAFMIADYRKAGGSFL